MKIINPYYDICLPPNIIFGWGSIDKVPSLVKSYHARNILIISSVGIVKLGLMTDMLGALHTQGLNTFLFNQVNEEPLLEVADEAAKFGQEHHCDLVIGFGGGSVIDTAKAVSMLMHYRQYSTLRDLIGGTAKLNERGLPIIAIPTTAGTGSEVTRIAIFTDSRENLKISLVTPHIIPNVAVVDPQLTLSLPPGLTAYTGIDALTHAIEAFMSRGASSVTDLFACEAIKLVSRNLVQCVKVNDHDSRDAQSLGSLLAGMAFANAGVGAAHALAYPLGGRYHFTHGLCVGMLLPAVMKVSASANPERVAKIAELMGCDVAGMAVDERVALSIDSVTNLLMDVGFPRDLRELGVEESYIEEMSNQAFLIERLLKNNLKQLTLDDIREIYRISMGEEKTKSKGVQLPS